MSNTELCQQHTGIQLKVPQDQPISDQSLSEYGRLIKFDDKFLKQANDVCKKVCDALKNSEIKPQRFSLSESHVCQKGKDDTGVDIVAFLAESGNQDQAKTAYQAMAEKLGAQKVSRDEKGVIHFDLDGVRVNLGVAVSRGASVGEHRKVLFQQISKMDKEGKLQKKQIEKVSVDLHDSTSEFMQQNKDEFDLTAQRLARAWRRTALGSGSEWFSPLDSMLVMQNTIRKERQRGQPAMKSVIRSFLNDMSNIGSMNLSFRDQSLYDWSMVPQWVQEERPLLLDPVNPWRNSFSGVHQNTFLEIQKAAQEALKMFEDNSSTMKDLFNIFAMHHPVLTLQEGKRAVDELSSHVNSAVDLMHHPPNDVAITDESLTEFAYSLALTSSEVNHMKSVAQIVLAECVQPLSNAKNIAKIIISENHLFFGGRNDSGFDMVVLMQPHEDIQATTESIKENVRLLSSNTAGKQAAQLRETVPGASKYTEGASGERPQSSHPTTLQFEFDGVLVKLAVGHRYSLGEKENREAVWERIEKMDKEGKLKKVNLDQFVIDLHESSTLFMHDQVKPDSLGAETGNEKFVQAALRLARAWRQCCLSHRDIQFSIMDAWLIMLHAVQTEVLKSPAIDPKSEGAAGVGGAVSGIRKSLKELFRGRGVTGKIQAGGHEVSMKGVFTEFLSHIINLETMNIQFSDLYDPSRVPDWVKTQRPLVLDPVCPYRNGMYNIHPRVAEDLKKHANECLKALGDPNVTLPKLFQLPAYKKRGA